MNRPASAPSRFWVLGNVVAVNLIVIGVAWNHPIVFVEPMLADLGLALPDWGTLWAAVPLGVMVCSLPAGAIGDRIGARHAMAAGLLIAGAALLLRAQATGFWLAWATMAGLGAGLALLLAAFPKAIAQCFPARELGMANGIAQAGVGVGIGVATLVAPLLAGALGGWRGVTGGLGLVCLGLAALWWTSVRLARPAARGAAALGLGDVARVLRNRTVALVALSYLLYMGGYLGSLGYLVTYFVHAFAMSPEAAGATLSLGPWSFTIGSLLLPTLSDRIGRRRAVFVPGMFAGGLALLAASASGGGVALALCIAALGFATGVVGLLFVIPIESEGVGDALAGSAVGAATTAGFLGGFASPMIGMRLVASEPGAGFAFWTGCFVASALLMLGVREPGRRARG